MVEYKDVRVCENFNGENGNCKFAGGTHKCRYKIDNEFDCSMFDNQEMRNVLSLLQCIELVTWNQSRLGKRNLCVRCGSDIDDEIRGFCEKCRKELGNIHDILNSSKSRQCYKCNFTLDFEGFRKVNENRQAEQLMKIWNDDRVRLLCCKCFDVEKKIELLVH